MGILINIVRQDVLAFLENNKKLFFNERDFQMHLATWLHRSENDYDDVKVEYYVPRSELKKYDYVWNSELRLDIVVVKDGEFCPVELKYKTKKVEKQIARFGEDTRVVVMKNQGAQDLGMYDFWKDVRRMELVRKRFGRVKGGLAVFVTNDVVYTKKSNSESNNFKFNMAKGVHDTIRHWRNPESSCAKSHPNFNLGQEYVIEWRSRQVEEVDFYYCVLTV